MGIALLLSLGISKPTDIIVHQNNLPRGRFSKILLQCPLMKTPASTYHLGENNTEL